MNKPLALILMIAVSLPLVSCFNEPGRRSTAFSPADEDPRSRASQRSQRYGHGGTHSPTERNTSRSNTADPDGIVKPDNLDPDPGGTGITGNPGGGATDVGTDTAIAANSGETPYAEAVPGKYGLVYSPFVTNKKDALVNVTDENNVPLPPGTEVTCPHTQKIFRVP